MEFLTAIAPLSPKGLHPALCCACNAARIIGSRAGFPSHPGRPHKHEAILDRLRDLVSVGAIDRIYVHTPDRRRSKIIGTLSEYPTRGDAHRIVERFRPRLNLQHRFGRPVTLDSLADHYVEKELTQLRYGTQQAHLSALNRWIRPRWGKCLLDGIRPMEVEQWLRSLPLAPKSKVNLRSLFHLVYQHGRRWELTDANPIDLVRRRSGRQSILRVLNVHDIRLVLEELAEPYRTMVLVAACLGLRASEIVGLQWGKGNPRSCNCTRFFES